MAETSWTAQLAAAAGAAAGTGAAQLGLGYGLGVVIWPSYPTTDDSVWLGSLGWATWIAASATVFGAVLAVRLSRRSGGPWRVALAASAALGALLPVALIALPARGAVRSDTFAPETIAAGYAGVGILLGFAIAYWAVASRPVAANLIATAVWLWALAATAIVVELAGNRPSATYLTSWQFADPGGGARYGAIYWPSSLLTLAAALIIGAGCAWPAVRRGDVGVGTAASGAAGPLLVAAAFFVLAPRLTDTLGMLGSAYLIAPYAVLAGLAGSAVTVAVGQRAAEGRIPHALTIRRPVRHRPAAGSAPGPARNQHDAWGADRPAVSGPHARATVTPPPAAPPIARINPPRGAESAADSDAGPAAVTTPSRAGIDESE